MNDRIEFGINFFRAEGEGIPKSFSDPEALLNMSRMADLCYRFLYEGDEE